MTTNIYISNPANNVVGIDGQGTPRKITIAARSADVHLLVGNYPPESSSARNGAARSGIAQRIIAAQHQLGARNVVAHHRLHEVGAGSNRSGPLAFTHVAA